MIYNCFSKDAKVLSAAKEIFKETIVFLASEGYGIDFDSVYKHILSRIDIDKESAAFLYQEAKNDSFALDKDITAYMTSEADLDKIASKANMDAVFKTNSKDKPSVAIAKNLLSFLATALDGNEKKAGDVKKILSDYGKKILGERKTGKRVDILAAALEREMKDTGFEMSYEELFEKIKEEFDPIIANIKDPVRKKTIISKLEKIKDAAFKLGITESGRKKVLYDAIKNSRFGKEVVRNGKAIKVVDWNALAQEEDINKALHSVLSDKLNELKYKGDKNKIYEALQDEINDIRRTRAYTMAITSMNLEGTNVMSRLADEVAISRGFYRMVDGKKVVDYKADNISGKIELKGEMDSLGLVYDKNDIKGNIDLVVSKYVKEKNLDRIRGSIIKLMAYNNRPFKQKITELDRLVKLKNVAGLDGTTTALAGKVLDLKINSVVMSRINDLIKQYESIVTYNTQDRDEFKKLFPDIEFNSLYSPALFSSASVNSIMKELSTLIRHASLSNQAMFVRGMDFLAQWQKITLSNQLSSLTNITQNITSGIVGLNVAGKDISTKYKKGNGIDVPKFRKMINTFKLYFDKDFNSEDANVKSSGFKNKYEADTWAEKTIAFIESSSSGVLRGIDGIAWVNGVSRSFYNAISSDLRVKLMSMGVKEKDVQKEIDRILSPYFSAQYGENAIALAKHFLEKAGITEKSIGKERYNRTLSMEADNIWQSFFMTGELSKYINPGNVLLRQNSAKRLTEMQMGRKNYHLIKNGKKEYLYNASFFGINQAAAAIDYIDSVYNKYLDELIKNRTPFNTWRFLGFGIVRLMFHGGPLAFLGGATRWADKAIGSLFNAPTYILSGAVRRRRKEYERTVMGKDEKGDTKTYNAEEVTAAWEDYDIARRRMTESLVAWGIAAAIIAPLMALGQGDDEDEESFFKRVWSELKDGMEPVRDHPLWDMVMKRIAPIQIRILYAIPGLAKKKYVGDKAQELGRVLFTTIPNTAESLTERYYRPGDNAGKVAAKMSKEFVGAIISFSPIVNPFGTFGVANPIVDEIRGSKKRVNFHDHPFLPGQTGDPSFNDGVANGIMWGFTGYAAGYAADMNGLMRTSGIEIWPEDYNSRFKDIDWAKYDKPEYNNRKVEISTAISKIPALKNEVIRFAERFGVDELNSEEKVDRAFRNYYKGIFNIELKDVNLLNVKAYGKETPSEKGGINVLRVAMNRVGIKDINLEDAEIAIQWQSLQEKLGK